jgi:hypothetical protein
LAGQAKTPEVEAERRRKISEARRNKMASLGYLNSPETRVKIGLAGIGRTVSAETRAKKSAAMRGRTPANFAMCLARAHARPMNDENHPRWKGDDVGYHALHRWVGKKLGRPSKCEHCGTETARKFEWANKSGKYLRSLDDWIRLCTRCHRKYDYGRG